MHWRAPIDKGSGNYIYIDTFNVTITSNLTLASLESCCTRVLEVLEWRCRWSINYHVYSIWIFRLVNTVFKVSFAIFYNNLLGFIIYAEN